MYLFLVTANFTNYRREGYFNSILVVVDILFGTTPKIIKWCFIKD